MSVSTPSEDAATQADDAMVQAAVPPEALAAVTEIFRQFPVAEKNVRLFPLENQVVRDSMAALMRAFGDFFRLRWEPIRLRVTEADILYEGESVYHDPDKANSLAFRLHKDGLKEIRFLTDLEEHELLGFLTTFREVLTVDSDEDDFVTLLWEKDLDQIQFFALDDFVNSKNEAPEIPTAVAIDRPLSAPGRAMSGDNDEVAKEIVDRAAATTDEGRPVFELDENDLKQIQSAIDGEVAKDPFEGFVEIVLEVVRNDADGQRLGKTLGILRNLIGSLAERADFGRAASIIEQLRMAPNLVQGEVNLLDQTMEAVAQDETMKRIQVHLEETGDLPPDAPLYRFLRQIPPSRLEWLCEWLALPGHARELSTILAEVGSDQWDLFVRHLDSGNGQVVKSIIVILGRLDPEAAVKQISRVASHDDPEVREMATMILAKSGQKSVARNLLPSLTDKSRKTRQHALDYFARVSFPMAFPVVRDIVASSGGQDDPKWLLLVMRALLRSDANKALDYLESTCFKKSLFRTLFKKNDLQHQQLAALYALGKDDQPATLRLLESLSKSMDKNIRNKAAHQLRSRQSRKASS